MDIATDTTDAAAQHDGTQGTAQDMTQAILDIKKGTLVPTSLNLANHFIGSHFEKIATALEENDSITALNLTCNNVGDVGASRLAAMLKASMVLQVLLLRDNAIGPRGIRRLAEALRENDSLTMLDLSANFIDEVAGAQLVASLGPSATLLHLNLAFMTCGRKGPGNSVSHWEMVCHYKAWISPTT